VVLGLLVVPFIALLALRFPSPSKTAASVKFYADSQQEIDHAIAQGDSAHENPAFSSLLAPEKLVVALATIMLFCDVGVEMSAAGFIPEFATQAARIKFSEVTAANLVAVYWAFFTLARFVAIAVSLRLSVTRQLGGTLIGLVASILVFIHRLISSLLRCFDSSLSYSC
jgi:fucose permease